MSLLDDVSIVVTPNGYKAGELYAVIPVPTEGADVIINGDFATDSDWSKGTGWTISGGTANCDGSQTGASNLNNSVSNGLVNNVRYVVKYTISNYSAGSIRIKLGNTGYGDYNSANGTYTATLTALVSTFPYAQFNADSSFVGSIDNISVKEYTVADMDVTRATAATRVDENGLVNYAEIIGSELVADGSFPTGTSEWGTGTGVTVGSGVATFTSTPSGQSVQQNAVATALPNGSLAKVSFEVLSRTEGSFGLYFSGTLVGSRSSVGVFTAYFTKGTQTSFYIRALGTTSGTISNVSVIEEVRDNVPRIDYTGGGCPHILAEPQRTNKLTYSEDFSQWNKSTAITVQINNAVSPSGDVNASLLSTTADNRFIYLSASSATNSTFSIYTKWKNGSGGIDLSVDGGSNYTSVAVTNEWSRVSITPATSAFQCVLRIPSNGSELYVWGAQLEAGYATSYIPTTGSAVTRNQDIFTRDGIGSLINSTEGVFFVEMAVLSADTINRYISLSNGTDDNSISFHFRNNSNNQVRVILKSGNSNQFDATYNPSGSTAFAKVAFKYKVNDFALWVNGTEIATDTSGITFSADTLNRLAFDDGQGGSPLLGKVKQLQVYKTALTDTQLAALTS